MTEDHDIMLAVRDGEMEQLGLLFHRHSKYLYNFFSTGIRDRDACEDLVQDVFLRILKYRHTYRDNASFLTWMFTIARNVRTDYFRGRKIRPEPLEFHEELSDENPSRDDTLERDNEVSLVRAALARLPHDTRELLIMSKFRDMRYKEIGTMLNCSEGAVKVRVFRALQDLRALYHTLRGDHDHEL